MHKTRGCIGALLLLLMVAASIIPALGENGALDNSMRKGQILDIYLNKEGKAFVAGYVHDIKGLQFINSSHYHYQNNTSRFDGITDALTHKEGDLWTMKLASSSYSDYIHFTLHLPGDVELRNITVSSGLQYFISTSNGTLVADVQGSNVQDSEVIIKYMQMPPAPPNFTGAQMTQSPQVPIQFQQPPIQPVPAASQPAQNPGAPIQYPPPLPFQQAANNSSLNNISILGFVLILVLGIGFAAIAKNKRFFQKTPISDETRDSSNIEAQTSSPKPSNLEQIVEAKPDSALSSQSLPEEDTLTVFSEIEPSLDPDILVQRKGAEPAKIEVSSEMKAILDTLTNNECIIMQTLIESGGKLTQAELRHRTEMAKSSLSGILLSLKNRKLINKIEYGHTNVVELSERFLSKNEHS